MREKSQLFIRKVLFFFSKFFRWNNWFNAHSNILICFSLPLYSVFLSLPFSFTSPILTLCAHPSNLVCIWKWDWVLNFFCRQFKFLARWTLLCRLVALMQFRFAILFIRHVQTERKKKHSQYSELMWSSVQVHWLFKLSLCFWICTRFSSFLCHRFLLSSSLFRSVCRSLLFAENSSKRTLAVAKQKLFDSCLCGKEADLNGRERRKKLKL